MNISFPPMMRSVLLLLRGLIVLNLVALVLFLLVLAGTFTAWLAQPIVDQQTGPSGYGMLAAVRAVMVIAILVVPCAHLLLTRLAAIVETVGAGDPFVLSNARRLKTIAWCLLAIQLLDLGFGVVSFAVEPAFGWTFSLTGWLAIILLFVLARVFEHGTGMRDELAGTV